MSYPSLVSIVIPAYKADFFEAALLSALRQNHDDVEIIICDDCPTEAIKLIVDRLSVNSRWPVRYFKNPVALREAANVARGIREARGEYIKFLYDDDILVPDAIRLMYDVLHDSPDIRLVSSARKRIDAEGNFLPDTLYTRYPFGHNVVIDGPELVSFLAQTPVNFIGEPSAVMCRRADVLPFGQDLMSLEGTPIWSFGDVALYVKLLRLGNLAMLARPLAYFRVTDQQSTQAFMADPTRAREGHASFHRLTRELGWVRASELNATVKIAPLAKRGEVQDMELRSYFDRSPAAAQTNRQIIARLEQHQPSPAQQGLIRDYLTRHDGGPAIAIVVCDFDNQPDRVLATLQSLATDPPLLERLKVFILADYDRQTQSELQAQLPWLAATRENRPTLLNTLMQDNSHDWWLLVDAGTTFTASGLLCAVMKTLDAPGCDALFCDEVTLDAQGSASLAFRSDFNLDYLLSCPAASSRHWLFKRQSVLNVGGFDPACAQAMELDLILRLIEHEHFASFAHCSEPLVIAAQALEHDDPHVNDTLLRHLHSRGYANSQLHAVVPGHSRIDYGHDGAALVSIIISAQDQLDTLQRCVESILQTTTYPDYEIIVSDNNSQSAETRQWLATLEALQSDRIRVLRHAETLSESACINSAAGYAQGEFIVLLAHDLCVVQDNWLENLLNHALRPEVGVVGAKLTAADGSIEHAGMILGLNGSASAVTAAQDAGVGYMHRLISDQNLSAVSGDCLMVRTSLYLALQGLDDQLFPSQHGDIDLCLRVRDSGHLVVWTPFASLSRMRAKPAPALIYDDQTRALYDKWLHYLAWDPAYNLNFSLQQACFTPELNSELSWRPLIHRPLPVVLVQPSDHSAHAQRITGPLRLLRDSQAVDGVISPASLLLPEFARLSPDTLVIQRPLSDADIVSLHAIKNHTNAFVVYDLSEFPTFSTLDRKAAPLATVQAALRLGLEQVDRVTVATPALAELLSGLHADIRVIESRLSADIWQGLSSQRRTGDKPRVGWVGSASQGADLLVIEDVIRALADKVDWVIMGPCPTRLRPFIHELRSPASGTLLPGLLASLNLDLALAPVEPHLINLSKSPTTLLEYGACGYPVICSDVLCYQNDLPVSRVSNETHAWIDAINAHIDHPETCASLGDALKREVEEKWMMDAAYLERMRGVWVA